MKRRELERRLAALGWRFLRHGGKHDVWTDGERRRAGSETSRDQRETGAGYLATCFEGAEMRFEGKLTRDGRFWLAEIPLLDAMTQGRTRKEALEMVGDWLETMVNKRGFRADVHPHGGGEFEVSGNDAAAMTALLLRRLR